MTWLAHLALVDQHFSPRRTQPVSVRSATTSGFAASEPRPGSESPKTTMREPVARSARWASFCSVVPWLRIGFAPRERAAPGVIATE
jgi:hypothetical protein